MQWRTREIGQRKQALLLAVYNELSNMAKKGLNPAQVAKFLKINMHQLPNNYTTKQLTGVVGTLREFNKVS